MPLDVPKNNIQLDFFFKSQTNGQHVMTKYGKKEFNKSITIVEPNGNHKSLNIQNASCEI